MRIKITLLARISFSIVLATMTMLIVFASRQEHTLSNQNNQARQKVREERLTRDREMLPEVDYRTFESQDETPRQIRKAKNIRYNAWSKPFEDYEENTEKTRLYCSWAASEVESFPAKESSVIIIGTVSAAKGYLSEDRSAAYSEYKVNVTTVLKGAEKLNNSQIIVEREGAKIVLPTGRKITYWVMKQGTPQVGHRYLLFLKNTPEGDYFVLTGYELVKGQVSPLDSISGKYEFFDGNEETAFIDIVRSSVN
jgi:hypothetical protein